MEKPIKKPVTPTLLTNDIFNDAYQEYSNTKLAERLNEKYKIKPYFKRFKTLRFSTLLTSYLFNILSAFAASSLVFFAARQLSMNAGETWANIIAGIITLAFIGVIEYKKRGTLSKLINDMYQFNKFRFGLFAVSLMIFVISVSFSYFGGKRTIVELTPPPTLMQKDSLEMDLQDQISTLAIQIGEARGTKWKGTTTTTSQRTIETLSKEKLLLTDRLLAIQTQKEESNGMILVEHESTVKFSASSFAMVTLACEVLFVFCMFYLEYYDYRSHSEMSQYSKVQVVNDLELKAESSVDIQEQSRNQIPERKSEHISEPSRFVLETGNIETIIGKMDAAIALEESSSKKLELKSLRKSVLQYKWKLNKNQGKPETALRNIKERIEDFEDVSGIDIV